MLEEKLNQIFDRSLEKIHNQYNNTVEKFDYEYNEKLEKTHYDYDMPIQEFNNTNNMSFKEKFNYMYEILKKVCNEKISKISQKNTNDVSYRYKAT